MTREEAILMLERIDRHFYCTISKELYAKVGETFRMAIEALKQKTDTAYIVYQCEDYEPILWVYSNEDAAIKHLKELQDDYGDQYDIMTESIERG